MPKIRQILCLVATVFLVPAFAQAQESEELIIERLDPETVNIEKPKIETTLETSANLGLGFINKVIVGNTGEAAELENVRLTTFGLSAEKNLIQKQDYSISAALSGEAGFGNGTNFKLNSANALGETDYRRLQVYGDVIARYEGGDETDWTPFVAAGVGLVEERITLDTAGADRQKFKELSPEARFRAGLEKKLSNRVTIGASVGKTVNLD